MRADDTTPKPARPAPRRVAWGTLMTDAPWDGRPRAAAPIHAPATAAGRAAAIDPVDPGFGPPPRSRKRVPLGALLANAPWAARPATVALVAPVAPAPELGRLAVTV